MPIGYQECEYIQSSGSQYINTGLTSFKNTLEIEARCSVEQQTSGLHSYWGGWGDSWSSSGRLIPTITTYTGYRLSSNFIAGFGAASGTDVGIRVGDVGVFKLKGDQISWNDTAIDFDRGAEFTRNVTFMIFASGQPSKVAEHAAFKLYYFKIWQDDSLVRDFVPALDNSNRPCLYDLVTNQPFYNAGTSEFSYELKPITLKKYLFAPYNGLPAGYQECEYLESTGTQYIDSGINIGYSDSVSGRIVFDVYGLNDSRWVGVNAYAQMNVTARDIGHGKDTVSITSGKTTIDFSYENYIQVLTVNGMTISRSWEGSPQYGGNYLIANMGGFSTSAITGKHYLYTLYKDGELVRDYIPALDTDGRPCLFDRVTKQPFYNAGTGEFSYQLKGVE